MNLVKSQKMLAAETRTVERGTTFADLMEKAGSESARIIYDNYCADKKNVLIISGRGKNGGDGFVISRYLTHMNCNTLVLLPCGKPSDEISLNNLNLLDEGTVYETDDYLNLIKYSDIIVDCLFGTGFRGSLDEKCSALAKAVNASGKTVVSIDIPSGAVCDTAEIIGEVIEADLTIAISALKPIHIMKPACRVCGRVTVADIGIVDEDFESEDGHLFFTLTDEELKEMLPFRPAVSNKGTFGNALCICGSRNMPGAAKIAAQGAMKSGAGLVTLAFPDAAYNAIAPSITEQVMLPCKSDSSGTFSAKSANSLLERAEKCTAALIGCGIGVNEDTKELVSKTIENIRIPLVIDADALNCIAENPEILRKAKAPVIITPHPGEMSRLTGLSISEILANPDRTAIDFSKKYSCITVLKLANTTVSDGEDRVYINPNGNSGLAKGGSGDLLSGIIVSLLAQGMEPLDAACAGIYIHGGCADFTARLLSERGMTVSDIITCLPSYLKKFE